MRHPYLYHGIADDQHEETVEVTAIAASAEVGVFDAGEHFALVAVDEVLLDLVFSCEGAKAPRHGHMWLSCDGAFAAGKWTAHPLSGVDGVKHDLIALADLGADGDLDAITTEEVKNPGVIWYENPAKSVAR